MQWLKGDGTRPFFEKGPLFCNQGSPHWDIGNPAKGDPNRSTDESSFVPKFIYFISSFTITISQHKNLHRHILYRIFLRQSRVFSDTNR